MQIDTKQHEDEIPIIAIDDFMEAMPVDRCPAVCELMTVSQVGNEGSDSKVAFLRSDDGRRAWLHLKGDEFGYQVCKALRKEGIRK